MSTTITQQAIERIKSMLAVAAEHKRGTTALFVEDVRAVLIRNAELERQNAMLMANVKELAYRVFDTSIAIEFLAFRGVPYVEGEEKSP